MKKRDLILGLAKRFKLAFNLICENLPQQVNHANPMSTLRNSNLFIERVIISLGIIWNPESSLMVSI